jgi:putative FmdB family regulatory protein
MPVYEFKCPHGTITEKVVPVDTQEIDCAKCHLKAKKIISMCHFILNGGGWYKDGYSSRRLKKN